MLLDHPLGRVQPVRAESVVPRQRDFGVDPELGLPDRMVNVNVRPLFLAREEVEAISTRSEDSRTHDLETPAVGYFRSSQAPGETGQSRREPLEPLLGTAGGVRDVARERFGC